MRLSEVLPLAPRAVPRTLFFVSLLGLAAVTMAGCPGPEYPKCESDDHCKKDKDGKAISEYCVFGQCQECAKDSHCGPGRACNSGRCEVTCTSDEQCGAGNICESARCTRAQCVADGDCGTGAACDAGRCRRDTSASGQGGGQTGAGDTCEPKGRVNFDFNVSELRPDSRATLDAMARCMKSNTGWRLTVEGHADERGTNEYNLSLGEARAKSIRRYLVNLGVDEKRIKVVSYGEEKPLDPASTEEAWEKNRRGELIAQ